MTTSLDVLRIAYDYTHQTIAGIGDDQWNLPTPCTEWDVTALVEHTTNAVINISGAAAAAAGHEPVELSSDLDSAERFRRAADASLSIWPEAAGLTVDLGAVQFPAEVAIGVTLLDSLTHGWDLAKATGQSQELPADAADRALAASQQVVSDDLRGTVGFAPPIEPGEAATATERLVAFLGRQP